MNSPTTVQHVTRQKHGVPLDRTRTGPYPPRPRVQHSLTFNETFRAIFPAILAVLLSMVVLSAFNNMDSGVIRFMDKYGIRIPRMVSKDSEAITKYASPDDLFNHLYQWTPQSRRHYENLGPFTSGSYWESKGREQEFIDRGEANSLGVPYSLYIQSPIYKTLQKHWNVESRHKYESLGALTSGSYWESKGRALEMAHRHANTFVHVPLTNHKLSNIENLQCPINQTLKLPIFI